MNMKWYVSEFYVWMVGFVMDYWLIFWRSFFNMKLIECTDKLGIE